MKLKVISRKIVACGIIKEYANIDCSRDVTNRALWGRGSFRKRVTRAAILLVAILLSASHVLADTAEDKALRGLSNILAGVMAFPGEIYTTWNKEGPAYGLTVGVGQGVGMIATRELTGVFEVLTSPVPWPNASFGPLLQPAYPWDYFQK